MTSHRTVLIISLSGLLSACTVSSTPFTYAVPAADVAGVSMDVHRGAVTIRGMETDQVAVAGESWGRAADEDKAAERQAGNAWQVTAPESSAAPLYISASSSTGSAGVDFELTTPSTLPTEIEVTDGRVRLENLVGEHAVDASGVTLVDAGGILEIQAGLGGVSGTLDLREGDDVLIIAHGGNVDLELPTGLDYDISVWSHPDAMLDVDLSGLWVEHRQDGFYTGRGLFGTVHITIMADQGDVTVRDAFRWAN
jgi:hypothetical protein